MEPMVQGDLIQTASNFHPWDAMAPAALSSIAKRGPFRLSVETGCGGSTIVFSQLSQRHIAFAIEGENRTISQLRAHPDLKPEAVVFVEGETRDTTHSYDIPQAIDMLLLDGPHAYPLPQVEFAFLFPHLKAGGWIVIDDIQIPTVYELFRFLKRDPEVVLEEVVVRTAFFRRVSILDNGPDGWQLQPINRHTILHYSWRDQLRKMLTPTLSSIRTSDKRA
jgi:precorrin-6B methylase 2